MLVRTVEATLVLRRWSRRSAQPAVVTTYNKVNLLADYPDVQQEPTDLPEFAALTARPGIPETTVASRELAEALSVLPHPPTIDPFLCLGTAFAITVAFRRLLPATPVSERV